MKKFWRFITRYEARHVKRKLDYADYVASTIKRYHEAPWEKHPFLKQ